MISIMNIRKEEATTLLGFTGTQKNHENLTEKLLLTMTEFTNISHKINIKIRNFHIHFKVLEH